MKEPLFFANALVLVSAVAAQRTFTVCAVIGYEVSLMLIS